MGLDDGSGESRRDRLVAHPFDEILGRRVLRRAPRDHADHGGVAGLVQPRLGGEGDVSR
jgi:hypothetical protein